MSQAAPRLLVIACLAAGCAPLHATPPLPEELAWLLVAELDPGGALHGATPLLPRQEAPLPVYVDPSRRVLVAGYHAATIRAAGEPAPDQPLHAAAPCELRLPAPAQLFTLGNAGTLEPADPAELPPLGADWLGARCGERAPPAVVLECPEGSCRRVVRGAGCRWVSEACERSPAELTVSPEGAACLAEGTLELGCAPLADGPTGVCAAELPDAPGCRLLVYPETQAPFVQGPEEPAVIQLPGATPFPALPGDGLLEDPSNFMLGYVHSLVVLGQEVLVSGPDAGGFPQDCVGAASGPAASRLYAHDVDSLRRTWDGPGPECLQNLEPDPLGPGFLASFRRGGLYYLGRFDGRGQELPARPLELGSLDPSQVRVAQLVVFPAASRVLVLSSINGPGSRLTLHDLADLAPLVHQDFTDGAWSLARAGEHEVLFTDQHGGLLCRYDVRDFTRPRCDLGSCLIPAFLYWVSNLVYSPQVDQLFAAVNRQREQLWACGQTVQAISFFEHSTQPGALHAWPGRPETILVSGVSRDLAHRPEAGCPGVGTLNLLDARSRRLLPGSWCLPGGVVNVMRPDGRGRLWLGLPWEGRLVRLTPR